MEPIRPYILSIYRYGLPSGGDRILRNKVAAPLTAEKDTCHMAELFACECGQLYEVVTTIAPNKTKGYFACEQCGTELMNWDSVEVPTFTRVKSLFGT